MVIVFTPKLFGIPRTTIPEELIQGLMDRESLRAIERMMKSNIWNNIHN